MSLTTTLASATDITTKAVVPAEINSGVTTVAILAIIDKPVAETVCVKTDSKQGLTLIPSLSGENYASDWTYSDVADAVKALAEADSL